MASSEEKCHEDPNFAVICSFFIKFGEQCGFNCTIEGLQKMLEDTKEIHEELQEIHIRLLRKSRKWFSKDKWEKALVKFCHEYSNVDAWELERFGYKKAKLSVKLELLKRLLELQFDVNSKFKSEVNRFEATSLRILPIGKDVTGKIYWFQLDKEMNIRVYCETPENESSWKLVCQSRDELVSLIESLESKSVQPCKEETVSSTFSENGDSNLAAEKALKTEDVEEKPEVTDTGQTEEKPKELAEVKKENESSCVAKPKSKEQLPLDLSVLKDECKEEKEPLENDGASVKVKQEPADDYECKQVKGEQDAAASSDSTVAATTSKKDEMMSNESDDLPASVQPPKPPGSPHQPCQVPSIAGSPTSKSSAAAAASSSSSLPSSSSSKENSDVPALPQEVTAKEKESPSKPVGESTSNSEEAVRHPSSCNNQAPPSCDNGSSPCTKVSVILKVPATARTVASKSSDEQQQQQPESPVVHSSSRICNASASSSSLSEQCSGTTQFSKSSLIAHSSSKKWPVSSSEFQAAEMEEEESHHHHDPPNIPKEAASSSSSSVVAKDLSSSPPPSSSSEEVTGGNREVSSSSKDAAGVKKVSHISVITSEKGPVAEKSAADKSAALSSPLPKHRLIPEKFVGSDFQDRYCSKPEQNPKYPQHKNIPPLVPTLGPSSNIQMSMLKTAAEPSHLSSALQGKMFGSFGMATPENLVSRTNVNILEKQSENGNKNLPIIYEDKPSDLSLMDKSVIGREISRSHGTIIKGMEKRSKDFSRMSPIKYWQRADEYDSRENSDLRAHPGGIENKMSLFPSPLADLPLSKTASHSDEFLDRSGSTVRDEGHVMHEKRDSIISASSAMKLSEGRYKSNIVQELQQQQQQQHLHHLQREPSFDKRACSILNSYLESSPQKMDVMHGNDNLKEMMRMVGNIGKAVSDEKHNASGGLKSSLMMGFTPVRSEVDHVTAAGFKGPAEEFVRRTDIRGGGGSEMAVSLVKDDARDFSKQPDIMHLYASHHEKRLRVPLYKCRQSNIVISQDNPDLEEKEMFLKRFASEKHPSEEVRGNESQDKRKKCVNDGKESIGSDAADDKKLPKDGADKMQQSKCAESSSKGKPELERTSETKSTASEVLVNTAQSNNEISCKDSHSIPGSGDKKEREECEVGRISLFESSKKPVIMSPRKKILDAFKADKNALELTKNAEPKNENLVVVTGASESETMNSPVSESATKVMDAILEKVARSAEEKAKCESDNVGNKKDSPDSCTTVEGVRDVEDVTGSVEIEKSEVKVADKVEKNSLHKEKRELDVSVAELQSNVLQKSGDSSESANDKRELNKTSSESTDIIQDKNSSSNNIEVQKTHLEILSEVKEVTGHLIRMTENLNDAIPEKRCKLDELLVKSSERFKKELHESLVVEETKGLCKINEVCSTKPSGETGDFLAGYVDTKRPGCTSASNKEKNLESVLRKICPPQDLTRNKQLLELKLDSKLEQDGSSANDDSKTAVDNNSEKDIKVTSSPEKMSSQKDETKPLNSSDNDVEPTDESLIVSESPKSSDTHLSAKNDAAEESEPCKISEEPKEESMDQKEETVTSPKPHEAGDLEKKDSENKESSQKEKTDDVLNADVDSSEASAKNEVPEQKSQEASDDANHESKSSTDEINTESKVQEEAPLAASESEKPSLETATTTSTSPTEDSAMDSEMKETSGSDEVATAAANVESQASSAKDTAEKLSEDAAKAEKEEEKKSQVAEKAPVIVNSEDAEPSDKNEQKEEAPDLSDAKTSENVVKENEKPSTQAELALNKDAKTDSKKEEEVQKEKETSPPAAKSSLACIGITSLSFDYICDSPPPRIKSRSIERLSRSKPAPKPEKKPDLEGQNSSNDADKLDSMPLSERLRKRDRMASGSAAKQSCQDNADKGGACDDNEEDGDDDGDEITAKKRSRAEKEENEDDDNEAASLDAANKTEEAGNKTAGRATKQAGSAKPRRRGKRKPRLTFSRSDRRQKKQQQKKKEAEEAKSTPASATAVINNEQDEDTLLSKANDDDDDDCPLSMLRTKTTSGDSLVNNTKGDDTPKDSLCADTSVASVNGTESTLEMSFTDDSLGFRIDGSEEKAVKGKTQARGRGRGRGGKGFRGRGRGRGIAPGQENWTDDSSPAEPVKRSRRIQEQNVKRMTQLAVQLEEEQRRLEALAKQRMQKAAEASQAKEKKKKEPVVQETKSTNGRRKPRGKKMEIKVHDLFAEKEDEKKKVVEVEEKKEKKNKKRKRKRAKKKTGKGGSNPWDVSSESTTTSEEEFEEEEFAEEEMDDEILNFDENEDEFACEEPDDSSEPVIVRRARTAKKARSDGEEGDSSGEEQDKPCERCGNHDHPEWILLCDKCDAGYHTSCLIPPLMIIPDGDWFCPPCDHKMLCEKLNEELRNFDQMWKRREREELRKQRLAYVGISLDNVLKPEKKPKPQHQNAVESAVESSLDEQMFSKRSSRQRKTVNYQFKEFDDLIASAIQDEIFEDYESGCGKGKDISNITNAEADETAPPVKKKKHRRLTELSSTEPDDDSDEDFKGSGSDTEISQSAASEELENSGDSEWRASPKHRSRRGYSTRRHDDFINDDSESEDSGYKLTRRRATQKQISYRELSSEEDDMWPSNKKGSSRKRKAESDESEEDSESEDGWSPPSKRKKAAVRKTKTKQRQRRRVWQESETSEEEEEEDEEDEESGEDNDDGESDEDDGKASKKKKKDVAAKEKPRRSKVDSEGEEEDSADSERDNKQRLRGRKVSYCETGSSDEEKASAKRPCKDLSESEASDEDDDEDEEEEDDDDDSGGGAFTNKKRRRIVSDEDEEDDDEEGGGESKKAAAQLPPPPAPSVVNQCNNKQHPIPHGVTPPNMVPNVEIQQQQPSIPPVPPPALSSSIVPPVPAPPVVVGNVVPVAATPPMPPPPLVSNSKVKENPQPLAAVEESHLPKSDLQKPRFAPAAEQQPQQHSTSIQRPPDEYPAPEEHPNSPDSQKQPKSSSDEPCDYSYRPNHPERPYGDPFPTCVSPLEDYPNRPSPLKPSVVEAYPQVASPAKLTPLDSYSQAPSPSKLTPLDCYPPHHAAPPYDKRLPYPLPHPAGRQPTYSGGREFLQSPLASSAESYRAQGSYGQGPFYPQGYQRPPHSSPSRTASPYSPSRMEPSPSGAGPFRAFPPHGQSPTPPPGYFRHPEYYSSQDDCDGAQPPPPPPPPPPSSFPSNYNQVEGGPMPYPYYGQPNGGFMIDNLLRHRNPEGGEDDELTGVTDIVSYITQE